jgi:hypothetical protein
MDVRRPPHSISDRARSLHQDTRLSYRFGYERGVRRAFVARGRGMLWGRDWARAPHSARMMRVRQVLNTLWFLLLVALRPGCAQGASARACSVCHDQSQKLQLSVHAARSQPHAQGTGEAVGNSGAVRREHTRTACPFNHARRSLKLPPQVSAPALFIASVGLSVVNN